MNNPKHIKYWAFVITWLAVLALFFIIADSITAPPSVQPKPAATVSLVNPLDTITTIAPNAYVYDLKTKEILLEKNSNAPHPLASLTKLMTALVSSSILKPDDTVTISKVALTQDGDNGLALGEEWKYSDLLNFSLLVSSNDGMYAIAEAASKRIDPTATDTLPFVAEMNSEAKALGLTSLSFGNPTGLDLENPDGSAIRALDFGSAKDVAMLLGYIITNQPDLLGSTRYAEKTFTSLNGMTHKANNTDTLINTIPGLIASKTGYTDTAGGNLAVAFDQDIGHPIVVVVLGSTIDGRFDDVLSLASTTRSYIQSQ